MKWHRMSLIIFSILAASGPLWATPSLIEIKKAAEKGDANAQTDLGIDYLFGDGVPQNYKKGVEWIRKAVMQGNAEAQSVLGSMYEEGRGIVQNYVKAAEWYRKSAERGNANGQYKLGRMYENGKGVQQNYVEAYKWTLLATAQNGDPEMSRARDALSQQLTPEQIAEAQKLASQWKPVGHSAETVEASAPTVAKELVSDVDAPSFKLKPNSNNFALVVGIEKYQKVPSAEFAERDANTMKDYLIRMGYPERNIIYLNGENATRSRFLAYLDEWLPKNVNDNSTVFVYFSGHGAPNAENKQAYLMPWDGDPEFLESTAYPLKQLYEALTHLKAKRKIVILDSCFSGNGGRSILAKGTRPLVTEVTANKNLGGVVLLAATSENEVTGTLDDQRHGIFTYYLLKGLSGQAKGPSGVITTKGLYRYLKPMVEDAAHRQNREQTPLLSGIHQDVELENFK